MERRIVSIWFRYLLTDWLTVRQPDLKDKALVFVIAQRGRKVVTAINRKAAIEGISIGMPLADAKALVPDIHSVDENPGHKDRLLKAIGEWCIRFTPIVSIDAPDGLFLDASGCTHLWNGEKAYLQEIISKFNQKGYHVKAAMADTAGAAWAVAHFGDNACVIESGKQSEAILNLPPNSLRLETPVLERLYKLGLKTVSSFISMPRSVLRRRFGESLLLRLGLAIGNEAEFLEPIQPVEPYQERLPCLEPIRTATGIEIAIQNLLEALCKRLQAEGNGLREAILKCYRIDGRIVQAAIGTNMPSCNPQHLFKLFEIKISSIEPALGIELFVLDAFKIEEIKPGQEALWKTVQADTNNVIQLLDRIGNKLGAETIHRYLPEEHYLPERSIRASSSINEKPAISWRTDKPRPIELLHKPEPIEVTAPIPDYPPMLFRYKGKVYPVSKADGPERIEQAWWLQSGEHRDYYIVEDPEGQRFWLFRSGHYDSGRKHNWFIHGFFA